MSIDDLFDNMIDQAIIDGKKDEKAQQEKERIEAEKLKEGNHIIVKKDHIHMRIFTSDLRRILKTASLAKRKMIIVHTKIPLENDVLAIDCGDLNMDRIKLKIYPYREKRKTLRDKQKIKIAEREFQQFAVEEPDSDDLFKD